MYSQPTTGYNKYTCPWCKEPVSPRDEKCPECGYPLKGDEDDIRYLKAEREKYLMELVPAGRKIRRGTYTLYLLAAVYFFVGAAGFFARDDFPGTWMERMATLLGCAVILLFTALFAKKQPAVCFITGLAVVISSSVLIYLNNDNPVPLVLPAFGHLFPGKRNNRGFCIEKVDSQQRQELKNRDKALNSVSLQYHFSQKNNHLWIVNPLLNLRLRFAPDVAPPSTAATKFAPNAVIPSKLCNAIRSRLQMRKFGYRRQ